MRRYGLLAGGRLCSDMPRPPAKPDRGRYVARPLGAGDWCVWDTRRTEPVFGTEPLRKDQAREAARRLSQAYRRALASSAAPEGDSP
jgi:hypothetical protein